ncbi:MAG: sigma-54 dependent transcriptional regulator [Desulfobacterales bacterium]|jgi:DNA-binding NtrC family response regulator|nr:sigma-54 dependent transcriptional regulator [Desulfobacterales bacterium]
MKRLIPLISPVLIFEKDADWQQVLSEALAGDYDLIFRDDKDAKVAIQSEQFQVILLDLLSASSGVFQLLRWMKLTVPDIPVIITSQSETAELVVKAIKQGAFDFVVKPFSSARIRHVVKQALLDRNFKNEINYLRHEQDVIYNFDHVVAESPNMKAILDTLRKFAQTDTTLLMTGETGTGKSFLSGTIHFNSHRKDRPFIKVNCANIPETLLESELFGHEKGAFTGADKQRVGRFEQAHGGTLFLDEIGEMSMSLQAKLLRVLEEKAFERVGGNRTIRSDVRVIAATNRDLESMIGSGRFREDLYYRINVLSVRLPPLRERPLCVEPLAAALLSKFSRSLGKRIDGFLPDVLASMKERAWPGNIRQLANAIERAAILADSFFITQESLPAAEPLERVRQASASEPVNVSSASPSLAMQEKEAIVKVLEECLWIQKEAAKYLGISPRALNYKINKYAIRHPRWRKHRE